MEGPLFQGSGEGMVPGAPGPARNGGIDGRHTLPAHTTPALRSGLPFTPSGGGHSSAGTWSSYSPFRGTEAGDYEETMKRHLCSHMDSNSELAASCGHVPGVRCCAWGLSKSVNFLEHC